MPSHRESPRFKKCVRAAKKAGQAIGIKVWPVSITWDDDCGTFRYMFRFPRYKREDKQALQIAESLLFAISLVHGPDIEGYEPALVFRVPAAIVRNAESIPLDKLVQVEEAREPPHRTLVFPAQTLGITFQIPDFSVNTAWKVMPVLYCDETLSRAARFLKASQDDFYIWPGDMEYLIYNSTLAASTGSEQSNIENALQNAFKAIEAIIGDPPKDDGKFFSRIRSTGLGPNDAVGYTSKRPLHEVIRAMNEARDKKSAHGSTPDRIITIAEMMEYQACAHLVVWAAIECKLGENMY
jgi:hypothetical protein